jgi:hypothetical protein
MDSKNCRFTLSFLFLMPSLVAVTLRATASLNINLTKVTQLGQQWNNGAISTFGSSLSKTQKNVNAGTLKGNKVFYDNDYVAQRGADYVTTLKMYSTRTQNTECVNSQNVGSFSPLCLVGICSLTMHCPFIAPWIPSCGRNAVYLSQGQRIRGYCCRLVSLSLLGAF